MQENRQIRRNGKRLFLITLIMAKGKIKLLVGPWSDVTIDRHGCALTLTAVKLGRGEGTYLGLKATEDLDIEQLENWTSREALPEFSPMKAEDLAKLSPELKKAYEKSAEDYQTSLAFRSQMFLSRVCDAFNSELRDIWRTIAEEYPTDEKAMSAEQKSAMLKEVTEQINAWLNGETKERVHDASYYRRRAKEQLDEAAKLVKGYGKKLAECTKEQQEAIRVLVAEKDRFIALAEAKEKEELSSIDDLLASL